MPLSPVDGGEERESVDTLSALDHAERLQGRARPLQLHASKLFPLQRLPRPLAAFAREHLGAPAFRYGVVWFGLVWFSFRSFQIWFSKISARTSAASSTDGVVDTQLCEVRDVYVGRRYSILHLQV